jgi:hypothetical protein
LISLPLKLFFLLFLAESVQAGFFTLLSFLFV